MIRKVISGYDNCFIIDGRSSKEWDMVVRGEGTFSDPERDVERVAVPGRNGDLLIDNGRWKNVDITYNDCFIGKNFTEKFHDFTSFCGRKRGYVRIEDSFHPDEYRMADMSQGIKVNMLGRKYDSGTFDLTVNCKPQRYLKSGEKPLQFLPPVVDTTNLTFKTHLVPVGAGEDIKFTAYCQYDTTALTLDIEYFTQYLDWSSTADNGTDSAVLINGQSCTFTAPAGTAYWRLTVSNLNSVENDWLTVQTVIRYGEKTMRVDAMIAHKYEFKNPTGYITTPMIEVWDTQLPSTRVTNLANGEEEDYLSINDTPFQTDPREGYYLYMDCELQYFYDELGVSHTRCLYIQNSRSRGWNLGLPFFMFGEETIKLQLYGTIPTTLVGHGPGLMLIYPRWWTK